MKHINKHNENMKHILFPLVLALLVLLTSCTEYERRRRDRSSEITIEGGYNGGNVYSKMDDDYAIGGTSPGGFSDYPMQSNTTSIDYGNFGSNSQSLGAGGSVSSSSSQSNGFNSVGTVGGIALNDKPSLDKSGGEAEYAPLGSGWFILATAGAGYAFVKRRKKDD